MAQLLFNLVEGIWWIGFGVWIVWHDRRLNPSKQSPAEFETSGSRIKSGMTRRGAIGMATILILFGISDFVEMATGVWRRPWRLLVWKGLCIGVGLILIIYIFKTERRRQ